MSAQVFEPDYFAGYREAKAQVAAGDIYDVVGALYLFAIDPPHNDFAQGMMDALRHINCRQVESNC